MQKISSLISHHILWRGLYFFSVLILNILIARFFAAENSGQIFYIVNNLAFVLLVVSLSLESGITFYISSGKADASVLARLCMLWAVCASFIAFGVWWIANRIFHLPYIAERGFLMGSFLFILGVLLTTYFTALFYSKKQFVYPNKILLLTNGIFIIFLLVCKNMFWMRIHFLEIYFFSFFVQGLFLAAAFFSGTKIRSGGLIPSSKILSPILRYSFAALLANIIYFLVNRIDYWFVQYYCSPKDLGNYIQASKLGQMLLILPGILGSTLFPILSNEQGGDTKTHLPYVVRILFWINIFVCLPVVCLGFWLFPLIFGESFNKMYGLFLLLIPGILCLTINYPLTAYNSSKQLIYKNIIGSCIALVIITAGDSLILPHSSVSAAAAISSVGYFFYFLFIFISGRKELGSQVSDYFLLKGPDLFRIFSRNGPLTNK